MNGTVEPQQQQQQPALSPPAPSSSSSSSPPQDGPVPSNAPEACPGTESAQAGKSDACYGCPNQSHCAAGEGAGVDPDAVAIAERLSHIRHKLLVLSNKGGAGKSTIAAQLAYELAAAADGRGDGGVAADDDEDDDEERAVRGAPEVGLLDIDICGPSAPHLFSAADEEVHHANSGWQPVYPRDNLALMSVGFMLPSRDDAVVWRGARKNGLIKQFLRDVDWGDALDYLLVDSPPGTSDEHITVAQYMKGVAGAAAVLVTTPQELALLDVRKEISFCRKAGLPVLGVIENMCYLQCSCCGHREEVFTPSTGGAAKMCADAGVPLLGSVPLDAALMRACERGEALADVATEASSPALRALRQIVQQLQERLQQQQQQ